MTDGFWDDPFHACALAAGFLAHAEGRLGDAEHVRRLAFGLYGRELAAKARRRREGRDEPPDTWGGRAWTA